MRSSRITFNGEILWLAQFVAKERTKANNSGRVHSEVTTTGLADGEAFESGRG